MKLTKKFSQLVSTSNKRSSSGEMKIDLKRVGIYGAKDMTLGKIKDMNCEVKSSFLALRLSD